jgi:hypothetical protein
MPDVYNIQTFEKIEGSNYEPTLTRFCKILQKIGLWNEEIKHAFDNFQWKVEPSGYVYSTITQLEYFEVQALKIKVKPLVMIYTPALGPTFKDNWICCELLIKARDLWSFENEQYFPGALRLVKSLAIQMQKEFSQAAIYFTDEEQDEEEFHAFRSNSQRNLWQFDYAMIPLAQAELYANIPKTHKLKKHKNYLEAWDVEKWPETPA